MRLDGNFLAIASHDNFVYIYAVTENGRKYSRVGKCTVSTRLHINPCFTVYDLNSYKMELLNYLFRVLKAISWPLSQVLHYNIICIMFKKKQKNNLIVVYYSAYVILFLEVCLLNYINLTVTK